MTKQSTLEKPISAILSLKWKKKNKTAENEELTLRQWKIGMIV